MLWTCISSRKFAPSILAQGFPSLCFSLWHDVLLLGVRFLCWVNLSQKRTDYWFISGYLQIITLRLPLQDTLQAARRSPRSRSLHLCNKYKKYRGFSLKSEKHSIFIKKSSPPKKRLPQITINSPTISSEFYFSESSGKKNLLFPHGKEESDQISQIKAVCIGVMKENVKSSKSFAKSVGFHREVLFPDCLSLTSIYIWR